MMFVLHRQISAFPEYFTLDKDHTVGSPVGAWTTDRAIGLAFARQRDAEDFKRKYLAFTHVRVMEVPSA